MNVKWHRHKGFMLRNHLAHRNACAKFSTEERLHRLHDGNGILSPSLFRDYEIIFEGLFGVFGSKGKSELVLRVLPAK